VPLQGVPHTPAVYAVALNESLGIPGVQALVEHLRVHAARPRASGSRARGAT
jgi:hypothetical protein